MVPDEVELDAGVRGVASIGITTNELTECIRRLLGGRLIARDVVDLLIIAHADQILRVGRLGIAGMDGHEPLRAIDRVRIFAREVVVERAHELRPAGPN